jgi:hypothetical protein
MFLLTMTLPPLFFIVTIIIIINNNNNNRPTSHISLSVWGLVRLYSITFRRLISTSNTALDGRVELIDSDKVRFQDYLILKKNTLEAESAAVFNQSPWKHSTIRQPT